MRQHGWWLVTMAWLLAANTAAIPTASACDAGGLAPLLVPGGIVLLGEVHGSVEGPALVADAACVAVARGVPLLVALEIPREEQDAVDRFLASPGSAADRAALLATPFWQRDFQDGRSSAAMADLLDHLRELRRGGATLRVALLDGRQDFASGQDRDDFMGARLVEAIAAAPAGAATLGLAGNVHMRTTPGVPWDAAYRPAALQVEQRWPERTVSLLLGGPPGETWMCSTPDPKSCGAAHIGGPADGEARSVTLHDAARDGYLGAVRLPATTPSPPAIGADKERSRAKVVPG